MSNYTNYLLFQPRAGMDEAYDPEDEARLDHGGFVHGTHQMNRSSSFVSRSAARELPWADGRRDCAQPGPNTYTPRMSSPRHRTAPSAAFASTTPRFAAEKSWDERSIAGGHRGDRPGSARPSAVFGSTARFEAEPKESPALGQARLIRL